MVRSSLVWTWCSEIVRVSPLAIAVCNPSHPTMRMAALRPRRQPERGAKREDKTRRAIQTGTCALSLEGPQKKPFQRGPPPNMANAVLWDWVNAPLAPLYPSVQNEG